MIQAATLTSPETLCCDSRACEAGRLVPGHVPVIKHPRTAAVRAGSLVHSHWVSFDTYWVSFDPRLLGLSLLPPDGKVACKKDDCSGDSRGGERVTGWKKGGRTRGHA